MCLNHPQEVVDNPDDEAIIPKLFALCTQDSHDPEASHAILAVRDTFARFAIVPQLPLSPRAAGLFSKKFFTELDFHANDSMTGKMVRFSHSKDKGI